MSISRMYPILPCPDLDEAIAFYATLGFERTYRQVRPPVVERARALVYRAELAIRLGRADLARSSLEEARALDLADAARADLAEEMEAVVEQLDDAR